MISDGYPVAVATASVQTWLECQIQALCITIHCTTFTLNRLRFQSCFRSGGLGLGLGKHNAIAPEARTL
jgi:hypothetical protein